MLFFCTLAFLLSPSLFAQTADVDYPVALVNSRKITKSEVDSRLAMLSAAAAAQSSSPYTFEQALQLEINWVLLLQAANREIDSDTRDRIRQAARQRLSTPADPKAFAPEPTDKQVDDYYRSLLVTVYLERKLDAYSVTPADVKAYYEDHRDYFTRPSSVTIRQILIRQDKRTSEEAHAIAESAAQRLAASEDFAAVAKEVSEGPYASEGGLWPPQTPGQMIPQMDTVAFSTAVGATSAPFQSPLGWHIIMVEKRDSESIRPYVEVQQNIYQRLFSEVRKDAEQKLIESLRAKAVIKILGA